MWADAICINQYDDTEKGHQVKRMGSVYENAEEVWLWLGKDTKGIAEDCFNLFRETTGYLDHQLKIYGGLDEIPTITLACPISFDKSRWAKFEKLVSLPWFCRLWVVQEAGLAKRCILLWGDNRLSLANLDALCFFLICRRDLVNLVWLGGDRLVYDSFGAQCTYPATKPWMDTKNMRFLEILALGRVLIATNGG